MKCSIVMNFFVVVIVVVLGLIVGDCHGDGFMKMDFGEGLKMNFYQKSCPSVEQIVQDIVWKNVATNPFLPAKLLRLTYHDCFVRGCEASVLLDSTANNKAEKDAFPNLSLRGFDVIDAVKTQLEINCTGVVSCADIIALAARDAVSYSYNERLWEVETGRRDGTVSLESEALAYLPSPADSYDDLKQAFQGYGLQVPRDLVVLSGAHTIGIGNCAFFSYRLFNFTGKGDCDPALNPTYCAYLKDKCQSVSNFRTVVPMDPGSGQIFDNSYFSILKQHEGLFQSDAALLDDTRACNVVDRMAGKTNKKFFEAFGESMKRMGAIGVLTGKSGEIRKKCSVINS